MHNLSNKLQHLCSRAIFAVAVASCVAWNGAWAKGSGSASTNSEAEAIAMLDAAAAGLVPELDGKYQVRLHPFTLLQHDQPEPVAQESSVWAPPGDALYRVNCGLTAAKAEAHDIDPEGWQLDRESNALDEWGAIEGRVGFRPREIPFFGSPYPNVLRTERYAAKGYRFPVPNGRYTLRLHFAEAFEAHIEPGQRVYDILVGEEIVWERFDPYAAGGGTYRGSLMEVRGVEPVGGNITIGFRSHRSSASISGIEVFEGSGTDSLEARLLTTAQERTPVEGPLPEQRIVRMLWVGNSHNFFWAIPESVASKVNASQDAFWLQPYRFLHGGWGLGRFMKAGKPGVLEVIEAGRYDVVSLQLNLGSRRANAGAAEQERVDRALERLVIFVEAVLDSGARPIVYMTSNPGRLETETRARQKVEKFLAAYEIPLIPAREAWDALEEANEADDLGLVLENDGIHIGLHTAYLNTCLHAIAWTGKPEPVSRYVVGRELKIDPDVATFIEAFAWDFWNAYDRKHGPLRFIDAPSE